MNKHILYPKNHAIFEPHKITRNLVQSTERTPIPQTKSKRELYGTILGLENKWRINGK